MLCYICKACEATVHLTLIAGDQLEKMDLCEECARAKGVNDPAGCSPAELLAALGSKINPQQPGRCADV